MASYRESFAILLLLLIPLITYVEANDWVGGWGGSSGSGWSSSPDGSFGGSSASVWGSVLGKNDHSTEINFDHDEQSNERHPRVRFTGWIVNH
ncbi:hypothetical protein Tcan_06403 [Toxocara canis]|uniref:Uncharacterized protein n=2 Tax=Toxocara canis TaxID=6265 RepID=A0A0B2VKT0_TOXCA|nr:hypothetical protein Tcan_06403 [Toxocara canis]VDM27758.1 unnamed protein product [Toxocara canis]